MALFEISFVVVKQNLKKIGVVQDFDCDGVLLDCLLTNLFQYSSGQNLDGPTRSGPQAEWAPVVQ